MAENIIADHEDVVTADPASGALEASCSSTLNSRQNPGRSLGPTNDETESLEDSTTDDNVFADELDERMNDCDSLDSEFEAYAQAYKARIERRRRGSHQQSWCSKNRNFVIVGFFLQFLAIISLVVTFVAMEKNTNKPPATADPPTEDPASLPRGEIVYLSPPPGNIDQFCREDADVGAMQACQEICDQAQCCHISRNEPGSCWNHNLQTCQDFIEACYVLDGKSSREDDKNYFRATIFPNAQELWGNPDALPPAPDRLLETCKAAFSWESNPLSGEEASGASLSCHEVCQAAACCWDSTLTEAADRCWTHPNCGVYVEACRVLQKARDEQIPQKEMTLADIPSAEADIADACNPNAIKRGINDLLACQEACLPAECCWNQATLHRCDSATTCDGYVAACSVLTIPLNRPSEANTHPPQTMESPQMPERDENTTTMTAISESSSSTVPIPELYTLDTIRDVCLNHDNAVNLHEGQKTLCQQACHAGSCCFYEGGASGTFAQICPSYLPANFCDKYAPCEDIFTEAVRDWTRARVREACTALQDLSDCVTVCAQATCCFTKDPWKACAATHPDVVCSDYHSCEILYLSEMEDVTYTDNDGLRHRRHLLRRR
jgi:hypothetical protein